MLTFQEILNDLETRAEDNNMSGTFKVWINEEQKKIGQRLAFRFTENQFITVPSKKTYTLWHDVDAVYNVRNTTSRRVLTQVKEYNYDEAYPDESSAGTPVWYRLFGIDTTREPKASVHTTEAGTDENVVVCSTLTSSDDEFYNGWLLVNTTHRLVSRVSNYDGATNTLSLETPISSQGDGDSFYLIKQLRQIHLFPVPGDDYTIKVRYWRRLPDMVNDYDVSLIPEGFQELLVLGPLAKYYMKEQNPRYTSVIAEYMSLTKELNKEYGMNPDYYPGLRNLDYGGRRQVSQLPPSFPRLP